VSFDQIKTPLQVTGTVVFLEVDGPDFPVVRGAMMFGKVVAPIFITRGPKHFELTLLDSVFQPIKPHVNGLAALLFNCAVDDAIGSSVVCLYWGWRLRMAQFFEGNAHWESELGIHV